MNLAFYIHNHQPVGNFDNVFEYAYERSYLPLIEALAKHQTIKFGIHNSGPLLEWINKNHPEFIDRLKELVVRGQAEIITSAYAEPILTLIPEMDLIDQIKYYTEHLEKLFGYRPTGLWLTERVWEPGLIKKIHETGIEYTLLDDTHFLYAGLEERELNNYFITEDEGLPLKVFPISMKLRYLIPFHPIDETIEFLRAEEKDRPGTLKTLGDDGEKFGVWPGTYDWVYKKGWLDNFLTRLENESWINTVFLKSMAQEKPAGRIYFPTSSYEEMGQWVLPPGRGNEYEELKHNLDRKYFFLIHGGYFKNFLRKYPEANHMHKRMLFASRNIPNQINAKLALWRGQCSCAYWHGIFGGLYLPHLREAIYRNLIEAENAQIPLTCAEQDFDLDGQNEIVCSNNDFFAVIRTSMASFIELDDREQKINILNYLGRREESYHHKIPKKSNDNAVKSIHEVLRSKQDDLSELLIYDNYPRGFGIDHELERLPSTDEFYRNTMKTHIVEYPEHKISNLGSMKFEFRGNYKKTISIESRNIIIKYESDTNKERLLGVEFSLGIFQPDLKLSGNSLREPTTIEDITDFLITASGLRPIKFESSVRCRLIGYPIETISSSESGYEKIFQGICILMVFQKLPEIRITL
ncbi:hypothetical protein A2Y85_05005 [candidate division WOR-3 bacterium RBG_13_43_14]|uniref:4-alpha-glucanotransferase n=1 Tax=candidate division WOR-3 bacterium RBG_13_43_14 TaxID=1802590 RepID=A0A1F4UCU4_UNCW3|nr:MAG: hypothetical protein A2Y85_05005 [candidate division WOR-3 bacterium RBG_13_43_14]